MPAPKLLPALALAAALIAGGCQNPDGSTDWGNTLLLGAGVGVAAALVAGAASNDGRHHGSRGGGRYRPAYAQAPRYGYADRHYGRQSDGYGR